MAKKEIILPEVAVTSNYWAGGYKEKDVRGFARQILIRTTRNESEIREAMGEFYKKEIKNFILHGGDGTIENFLTLYFRLFGEPSAQEEPISIIPIGGGTMNFIHNWALGALKGNPGESLETVIGLILSQGKLPFEERNLVKVEVLGQEPEYGFLFMIGLPINFLRFYYEKTQRKGRKTKRDAYLTFAQGIASLFSQTFKKHYGHLHKRLGAKVFIDGIKMPQSDFLGVAVSSLETITFGIKLSREPYTGGKLYALAHWGKIEGMSLGEMVTFLWSGKYQTGQKFVRRKVTSVQLVVDSKSSFTLDGEMFEVDKLIKITTGPRIRILKL